MMKYTTEQLETAIILFNSNLRFELKDTVEFKKTFSMAEPYEDEVNDGIKDPHLWYYMPYSNDNSVFYKSEELFFLRPEMINGKLILRMTSEELVKAKKFASEFIEKELQDNVLDICHLADVFFFGGLLSSIEEETVSGIFESLQGYGDIALFLYNLRVAPFGDTLKKYIDEEGDYYVSLRYRQPYENGGEENYSNWSTVRYLDLVDFKWFLEPWKSKESMTYRLLEIYKMMTGLSDSDYRQLKYIVNEFKDWCIRSGNKFPERFELNTK